MDAVGLPQREEHSPSKENDLDSASKAEEEVAQQTSAKREESPKAASKSGLTLSGLLNVIDGIASPEGRILILTSNFPERLDAALLRPGRIDMQVEFTNITKEQAGEIFVRMYTSRRKVISCSSGKVNKSLDIDELANLAQVFAQGIPDNVFSPAEV